MDDLINFSFLEFYGSTCKFFGREGGKYINFRAKSKFFVVIYKLGDFFPKGIFKGGGGVHGPLQPQGSSTPGEVKRSWFNLLS